MVFGIAQLLGVDYRPALADLPGQKGVAGRQRSGLRALEHLRPGETRPGQGAPALGEILRLTGSIYTSQVSTYDVVRALQRDGRPTALGEAVATYGRLFKTLHLLSIIDSEPYRRGIKGMRNL
jgi:TnpA family transposase